VEEKGRTEMKRLNTKVKNSYGIILVARDNPYKILMVKKRISYAFTEFLLGNLYTFDDTKLMNLFNNMTFDEKIDIISMNYGQLWYRFTLKNPEVPIDIHKFRRDELEMFMRCKNCYESTFLRDGGKRLLDLVSRSRSCGSTWEIPKGKKKTTEKDLTCAIREVYEETGISCNDYILSLNERHIINTVTTPKVTYYNHYYVALYDSENPVNKPKIIKKDSKWPEIIDICWLTTAEMKIIGVNPKLISITKNAIKRIKKKYKQSALYNI